MNFLEWDSVLSVMLLDIHMKLLGRNICWSGINCHSQTVHLQLYSKLEGDCLQGLYVFPVYKEPDVREEAEVKLRKDRVFTNFRC